jgi:ATP-dependent DNA ligase
MTLIKDFGTIYGKDKNGRTRVWTARVDEDDESNGVVTIEHGLLDGALQTETRIVTEGKNIGRSNETTPVEQAVKETERRYKDKITKESYTDDLDSLNSEASTIKNSYGAMLAGTLVMSGGKKCSASVPFYVQPKLDGLRCLIFRNTDGEIMAQSRQKKYFPHLDHIKNELKPFFEENPHIVLDGELFTFDYPFEELAGLIKKEKKSKGDLEKINFVKYHVYDYMDRHDMSLKYMRRLANLMKMIKKKYVHTLFVKTIRVETMDEFKDKFSIFVSEGYEGIMIRKDNGVYDEGNRSSDLLKYKEFMESEFEIVGYKEGTGRDSGTIIWECITPEGNTFSVRPIGTIEHRKELLENAESYIGKQLTVKYQELSELKVPRFPVGKDVREGY